MFQSTHPRGVRRDDVALFHGGLSVSIHAPTRGATPDSKYTPGLENVSIHAPTRGATLERLNKAGAKWFQSTHPRGVRQMRSIGFH